MTDKIRQPSSMPNCKGCYRANEDKAITLNQTDFLMLQVLNNNDLQGINMSPREIKNEMAIYMTEPNVVAVISRLHKYGRVRKDTNPKHAISFIAKITPIGKGCFSCYLNPEKDVLCHHPLVEALYTNAEGTLQP